jgi:hypothetical protein
MRSYSLSVRAPEVTRPSSLLVSKRTAPLMVATATQIGEVALSHLWEMIDEIDDHGIAEGRNQRLNHQHRSHLMPNTHIFVIVFYPKAKKC